jgi:tetratricopeptide (TPR) repeat protein
MKRILIVCSFFLGLHEVNGQESMVSTESTFNNMNKKIQKSDQEIQDPKKGILSKTWLNHGTLYQEAYEINNLRYIVKGKTSLEQLKIYFKEPGQIESVQLPNGTKQDKYIYYGFTVTLENGVVTDFNETKTIDDNALDKAFDSFLKSRQLDAEKKMDKKLKAPLESLRDQSRGSAIVYFEKGESERVGLKGDTGKANYRMAFHNFERYIAIDTFSMVQADTLLPLISYYTGLSSLFSKNYDGAIKYFDKAKTLHLKESKIFYYLELSYLGKTDTATAIISIKEGTKLYPTENFLIIELVNLYIRLNEAGQALEYLNKAKALDPTNKTLYFAEGTLFDKIGKGDSAKVAYENALRIDPEYFDATYNLGVYYYNNAVKLYTVAANESDINKYNQKKTIADEELKKSVPVMEKAHQIMPKDALTMQTLKTLYYRLKMEDKLKMIKQELGESK